MYPSLYWWSQFLCKKMKLRVVPPTILMIDFFVQKGETRSCIPHYIDDNDRKTSPPPPGPLCSFQRCALVVPPPGLSIVKLLLPVRCDYQGNNDHHWDYDMMINNHFQRRALAIPPPGFKVIVKLLLPVRCNYRGNNDHRWDYHMMINNYLQRCALAIPPPG